MNKINCTIVGSSDLEQLDQNIEATEIKFSEKELEKFDRITLPIKLILGNNEDLWQTGKDARIK